MKRLKWYFCLGAALLGLTACGGEEETDDSGENLLTMRTAVAEVLGEEYRGEIEADAVYLQEEFGITEEMYDSFLCETSSGSDQEDLLLIVRAKEDMVDTLREQLEDYYMEKSGGVQNRNGVSPKIQAARLEVFDRYVCYVMLGGDVETAGTDEEAVIRYCLELNELALEVIYRNLPQ